MKIYTVKDGDTFDAISTIFYGSAGFADLIRSANPHTAGGLAAGMVLNIPSQIPREIIAKAVANSPNEVQIKIDGAPFRFWTSFQLVRSIDTFDRFRLGAPFTTGDEPNVAFADSFVPFGFQTVELFVGGDPLFTGTVMTPPARLEPKMNTVAVEAYALCGVLNDVTLPAGEPLEYDGQDLKAIAEATAKPFGLKPTFTADPGPAIERVAISQSGKLLPFWMKLSKQRGLVIANDSLGQPLFQEATSAKPIQNLEQGLPPIVSVEPRFNPQQYYSHISAVAPSFVGFGGDAYTVSNPHLRGVLRPFTFLADDTFGADSAKAAEAKVGRMFGNAVQYTVEVSSWRDGSGNLWQPNTRVRLSAPGAMIYSSFEFLIRSVTFNLEPSQETATLTLVLPESFGAGGVPESLPWDR